MPSKSFQELLVWQKAHRWVLDIYKFTSAFPRQEVFGLAAQFRRAAVSVPANIAEGFKKAGIADKVRYYNISQGSIEECRYYLILASDLGYGDSGKLRGDLDEVCRLLQSYMSRTQQAGRLR